MVGKYLGGGAVCKETGLREGSATCWRRVLASASLREGEGKRETDVHAEESGSCSSPAHLPASLAPAAQAGGKEGRERGGARACCGAAALEPLSVQGPWPSPCHKARRDVRRVPAAAASVGILLS